MDMGAVEPHAADSSVTPLTHSHSIDAAHSSSPSSSRVFPHSLLLGCKLNSSTPPSSSPSCSSTPPPHGLLSHAHAQLKLGRSETFPPSHYHRSQFECFSSLPPCSNALPILANHGGSAKLGANFFSGYNPSSALSLAPVRSLSCVNVGSSNVHEVSPRGLFTPDQWVEFTHQMYVFKDLASGVMPPPSLLVPVLNGGGRLGPSPINIHGGFQGQGGLRSSLDLEPWRCRRTDGKKWRCAKEVMPDQRYCEKHVHRGRHRSRAKNAIGGGAQQAAATPPLCNNAEPPSSGSSAHAIASSASTTYSSSNGLCLDFASPSPSIPFSNNASPHSSLCNSPALFRESSQLQYCAQLPRRDVGDLNKSLRSVGNNYAGEGDNGRYPPNAQSIGGLPNPKFCPAPAPAHHSIANLLSGNVLRVAKFHNPLLQAQYEEERSSEIMANCSKQSTNLLRFHNPLLHAQCEEAQVGAKSSDRSISTFPFIEGNEDDDAAGRDLDKSAVCHFLNEWPIRARGSPLNLAGWASSEEADEQPLLKRSRPALSVKLPFSPGASKVGSVSDDFLGLGSSSSSSSSHVGLSMAVGAAVREEDTHPDWFPSAWETGHSTFGGPLAEVLQPKGNDVLNLVEENWDHFSGKDSVPSPTGVLQVKATFGGSSSESSSSASSPRLMMKATCDRLIH